MVEEADDGAVTVAAAYDAVARQYSALYADQLSTHDFERTVIESFGAACRASGNALIADCGCGPGRVADYLKRAGNHVVGVDVSPEMIAIAREAVPDVDFFTGSMFSFLDDRVGTLGHLLFWYSIIHLPPEELGVLLLTAYRALQPGGRVLLAFQSVDDSEASVVRFDHRVAPAYRYSVTQIRRSLTSAGFTILAWGTRSPDPDERFPASYVLALRPESSTCSCGSVAQGRPDNVEPEPAKSSRQQRLGGSN